MATSEITIRGGGVFGLTLAFCLLQRNAKVHVVEKRRIGAGASGGLVGALAPHTPDNWNEKKEFQFQSLIRTGEFWAEVEKISARPSGYARTGRLQIITTEKAARNAGTRSHSAKEHWQGLASWSLLDGPPPQGWTLEQGKLVFDDLSALIAPRAALASLTIAIQKLGGRISENQDGGAAAPGPVVDATGYEGLVAANLGNGQKGQGALLAHDAAGLPQVYGDGLHIIPHLDGTVAIGSTSENEWTHGASDEKLEELIARARNLCPDLASAPVIDRWAGIRPRGHRRSPIIGRKPGVRDHYVFNGGFKIGFGVAVEGATLLSDLILTGTDRIPQSFRPGQNL